MSVICSKGSTLLVALLRGTLFFVLATLVLHLLIVMRIFMLLQAFLGWLCPCCDDNSGGK
jgi:hypothetical protein